jgi:hypothetical protein
VYCFNSRGYWKDGAESLEKIPLQTSLTLQTAVLTDQLEWEEWKVLPGTMIPKKEFIDKVLPGYYDKYNPSTRQNPAEYIGLLKNRFQQRIDFLKSSDVKEKPELIVERLPSLVAFCFCGQIHIFCCKEKVKFGKVIAISNKYRLLFLEITKAHAERLGI